jgi:hypothetical protein
MEPTQPQWAINFGRSREAKTRIRHIRQKLADGSLTLSHLLISQPDQAVNHKLIHQAQNMRIGQLLRWVPGIGEALCRRILLDLDIDSAARVAAIRPDTLRSIADYASALAHNSDVPAR